MPTKCTSHQLLNPQGRKAWREDGPTRGQDLWEVHGVWKWDSAKNTGAVLRKKYFVSDPATGRKVRVLYADRLVGWKDCAYDTTGRLVHGLLLPILEALD